MLLLLPACHLFASGQIPCTQDEPCDTGVEADTDTDADSDTDSDSDADSDSDSDSDADSDADADPLVGAVVTASNGSQWAITTFAPDGTVDVSLTGTGATYGPIVWDESLRQGATAQGTELYSVDETDVVLVDTARSPVRDVAWSGDTLYVIVGNELWDYTEAPELLVALDDPRLLVAAADDTVFVVDTDDNTPSLLRWTPGSGISPEAANYDTLTGRSHAAYLGPGDAVWTCSEGGGTWSVAELAAGVTSPARLAQGALTDIVDCGYDAATDEVLMFSASRGVFRVAPDSTTTEMATEPNGLHLVRGADVR